MLEFGLADSPHFELLPPSLAVADTLERRADPLIPHKETWVAFAVDQAPCFLMVDCETAAVSPVVYSSEGDGHDRAAACSVGHLVEYWTHQIETGESYHDGHRWRQAEYAQPATPLFRW